MVVVAIAAAAVFSIAVAVVALVLLLGSNSGQGASADGGAFNDVSSLESSIQSTYNGTLSADGASVTNVSCISTGDNQYDCALTLSTGTSVSHHVTVDSSGDHWIADTTP